MLKGVYPGCPACLRPPTAPPPQPVPPMSSRSLSCGGPLLASPGLGPLPGAPPGVGSAGRQCLDHVLWAAGRGPGAGAASRGAWPPEAPPGASQADSRSLLSLGAASERLGSGRCGWQQEPSPRPTPLALLWTVAGGPSLAGPSSQPPGHQSLRTQGDTGAASCFSQPCSMSPVTPSSLGSHDLGPGPLGTLTRHPCPILPSSSAGPLSPSPGLSSQTCLGLPLSNLRTTLHQRGVDIFHPLPRRAGVPRAPSDVTLSVSRGCSGG